MTNISTGLRGSGDASHRKPNSPASEAEVVAAIEIHFSALPQIYQLATVWNTIDYFRPDLLGSFVMVERKPDFEDESIRLWRVSPEDRKADAFEKDPTVMSLDVEKEEVFESRTYRFTPSPEALGYLITLLISQRHEFGLGPEAVVQGAMELMKDASFKFLAKRRKEDGLVSSLLVGLALGGRRLLGREEWVEESEYRRIVRAFEGRFLGRGILNPPLVVTLEEWRGYFKKGPLSGGQ